MLRTILHKYTHHYYITEQFTPLLPYYSPGQIPTVENKTERKESNFSVNSTLKHENAELACNTTSGLVTSCQGALLLLPSLQHWRLLPRIPVLYTTHITPR